MFLVTEPLIALTEHFFPPSEIAALSESSQCICFHVPPVRWSDILDAVEVENITGEIMG